MGKKVPISVDNIAFERLDLSRHYLTVDCDFTCFLVLNPSGDIPCEGTDICALHTGAWQIDAWKLLTKKDFPNQAGFIACLVWDRTLVTDTARAPSCVESDIDTANSVSSLKGQPVNITSFTLPAGEALPVSLVSGSGVPFIGSDNPLPVREYRQRCLSFNVGSPCSIDVLRGLGFEYVETEGSDVVTFSGVPVTFCGRRTQGNTIYYDRGLVSCANVPPFANYSKYDAARFWVSLGFDIVQNVLASLHVDADFSKLGIQSSDVVHWNMNMDSGYLSV